MVDFKEKIIVFLPYSIHMTRRDGIFTLKKKHPQYTEYDRLLLYSINVGKSDKTTFIDLRARVGCQIKNMTYQRARRASVCLSLPPKTNGVNARIDGNQVCN